MPDEPDSIEIPTESLQHPIVIWAGAIVATIALAAWGVPYARRTIAPAWRWATGRDTRAYAQLLGEVELLREQLEDSREERRLADERHSSEIASLRKQYEEDMQMIQRELIETRRQLLAATVKGA